MRACETDQEKRYSLTNFEKMAAALRLLAIDGVEAAKSGHPGMPLGMADVAAVLWGEFLTISPEAPLWSDRDRFVLSAGHGSMLLYALLHLSGFGVSRADLQNFRQLYSATPGHPEYGHTPGVEVTTGPLAQGLGHAVGMAMAEAGLRQEYSAQLVDHWTYVMAGDGCLMEGLTSESISLAGHLGLGRLIVLFDDNGITIDGATTLSTSEDHKKRFEAVGWQVLELDGHNYDDIHSALIKARADETRPSLLMCRTTIGKGAPTKAGTAGIHGAPLGSAEATEARIALGFGENAPFELPNESYQLWARVGERGNNAYTAWVGRTKAWKAKEPNRFDALKARLQRIFPAGWQGRFIQAFSDYDVSAEKATRAWSGDALACLAQEIPGLLGGSADLTPSNNTKSKSMTVWSSASQNAQERDESGTPYYVHYGIREHAMAAAMGGLVLHGGFVPYGGTFLTFSDYMRPAIRLAALMKIPVIYVFTHDSIGLGEDGPTHQPVEHIASLRLIPHLAVLRPADGNETAACWILALERQEPSALLLSRQKVSGAFTTLNDDFVRKKVARGAYILKDACANHQVTLFATGSEVSLADTVRSELEKREIGARLISIPCLEFFETQDAAYKKEILSSGKEITRVSVEAGSTLDWRALLGSDALTFGVKGFGLSAPADAVYKEKGLDVASIISKILDTL